MEEEDQQKVADLIKELVIRLLSQNPNFKSHPPTPNSPEFQSLLLYAFRLISTDITQSIKRRLATQGKSSQSLTFTDLYTKFASKTGSGSVNNKWAVVYLHKIVSEDRKMGKPNWILRLCCPVWG
ncbi:gamma-tubulin complex component 3 [Pyrus ussuriensis x Pyrus communis]|uniref:Gamma-tubulin complex component 3 n=1 Tax=Pyrus ussuriensis x Pyrus communis TaxID=2448454 RepID=A0A5N5FXA9_9ROSA|nr:gamma-tubulin complex component 3 [Pyrus ussuriensis x Pyrus communis]